MGKGSKLAPARVVLAQICTKIHALAQATIASLIWTGLVHGTPSPLVPPLGVKTGAMTPGPAGIQPTPGLTANMPPPLGPRGWRNPCPRSPLPAPRGQAFLDSRDNLHRVSLDRHLALGTCHPLSRR